MRFSLIIVTRKRVGFLKNLVKTIYETTTTKSEVEVHITYDDDDKKTADVAQEIINKYPDLKIEFHPTKRSEWMIRDYVNWTLFNFCTGKYILNLNDDVAFVKKNWDELAWAKLEDYLKDKPDGVVYGLVEDNEMDKINHPPYEDFSCFPIISRAACDALGGFLDNEYRSWGSDIAIFVVYDILKRVLDLRQEVALIHISVHSKRRKEDKVFKEMVKRATHKCDVASYSLVDRDVRKLMDYILSFK